MATRICARTGRKEKAANRTGGHCLSHFDRHGVGPSEDCPPTLSPCSAPREPLFLSEKLAICYRNRPHDAIIGIPYETWQALCLEQWARPGCASYVLPDGGRGMGIKAPDAVPLDVRDLMGSMSRGTSRTVMVGAPQQVVWLYPVIR